jgi:hypothetical protein
MGRGTAMFLCLCIASTMHNKPQACGMLPHFSGNTHTKRHIFYKKTLPRLYFLALFSIFVGNFV